MLLRSHRGRLILLVTLLAVKSRANGVTLKHFVWLRDRLVWTEGARALVLARANYLLKLL